MIKSILKLPLDLAERLLNTESDWIRYGLPALILTVALSIAMASKSDQGDSSRTPFRPRSVGLAKSAVSADGSNDASANEQRADSPNNSALAKPQMGRPAPELSKADGSAGRIAVCEAVKASLPDYKAGKLRKLEAIRRARQGYRGQNAPQMASQSVNQALLDYNAGVWSEADCPNPGLLSKGLIGAVVNRRYRDTN